MFRPKIAEIFLWRRIPHPDKLNPGGPEIDVGISTANSFILVETKWLSAVGKAQGEKRDKDQIQVRREFLKKYAKKLLPNHTQLAVVGIGLSENAFTSNRKKIKDVTFRTTTWETICSLKRHPLADEVRRYFNWKKENTKFS